MLSYFLTLRINSGHFKSCVIKEVQGQGHVLKLKQIKTSNSKSRGFQNFTVQNYLSVFLYLITKKIQESEVKCDENLLIKSIN